jgi:hypothetical protein
MKEGYSSDPDDLLLNYLNYVGRAALPTLISGPYCSAAGRLSPAGARRAVPRAGKVGCGASARNHEN